MKLRIAGTVNDSIVDGPGIRFTVFVQGCPHNCRGCHNPQTHDFNGGTITDTEELLEKIKSNPLLDGVTFSVAAGEHVAVVGRSGAGKTTLVNMILGLLQPTQGSHQMDGVPITQWNQIKPCFGYVSQNPCIITGTIAENIAFGAAMFPERVRQAMDEAQLHEFTPNTMLDEMGKNISGGQRQRIAIARALYRQARLLVLDEITSSLDALTEQKIMDAINRLKGHCTIIAIAHRLGTLRQCNRILYMEAGRIKAEGNFEQLYQQSADFRQIVDTLQQANNTKPIA